MSLAKNVCFSPRPRIIGLPPFLAATMRSGNASQSAPKA
jgi:hypothetical protein